MSFDDLVDPEQRQYFKELPTRFKLAHQDVDQLKWVADRLLQRNQRFRALAENLQGKDRRADGTARLPAREEQTDRSKQQRIKDGNTSA